MVEVLDVPVKAYEGHYIHNEFYRQSENTDTLTVVFPGGNYGCDKPLLHYARKAALLNGYDVLCIKYGRKEPLKEFADSLEVETNESFEAIRTCMQRNYRNFYFVGKSLGTAIAGRISKELGYDKIRSIFMSPIGETIQHIVNSSCLVILGTKDRFYTEENIRLIRKSNTADLVEIQDGKHSLEFDEDLEMSINVLSRVTGLCSEFLRQK